MDFKCTHFTHEPFIDLSFETQMTENLESREFQERGYSRMRFRGFCDWKRICGS